MTQKILFLVLLAWLGGKAKPEPLVEPAVPKESRWSVADGTVAGILLTELCFYLIVGNRDSSKGVI